MNEILLYFGLVMVMIVLFIGLPVLVYRVVGEFKMFGLDRHPVAHIIFRAAAVAMYLVLITVFFLMNMEILV